MYVSAFKCQLIDGNRLENFSLIKGRAEMKWPYLMWHGLQPVAPQILDGAHVQMNKRRFVEL